MQQKQRIAGLTPAAWTFVLIVLVVAGAVFTALGFNRDLQSYADVTMTSDRAGLVMDPGAQVKLRGVQVGRVASIGLEDSVKLQLELYPGQLEYIPANVEAEITAPTAFGAKYVELITPDSPSSERLSAGAVITSRNVSVEVNTVFQNLVGLLNQIDVSKLNAVLSALGEGFRGKGEALGQATTDLNDVLIALNSRSDTVRDDYRALKGFSDTYGAAAQNIVSVLDAASTTSSTITNNAQALDTLLVNVTGLSRSGINLIAPSKDNLVNGINSLEPTTRLLMKYSPEYACLLVGGKLVLDSGLIDAAGGSNGKSLIGDAGLLFGDDPYQYPQNLPINGAKGGPGGQPGCGSLPDVAKNFPVRALVTNTGIGTGLDFRPNPGIGFPGLVNFGPVTRGTPQPPSIHNFNGPAPGPVPYPGAPPFGAPWYASDGTPMYPGLPPAPPPGRPRDPDSPPGSEPFVVAHPAEVQPTPLPTVVPPPPLPPLYAPEP